MIGKDYVVPYHRVFPIWTFGPIYDAIDGRYVRDGWYPERYGEWRFKTPEEAEAVLSR
jgi:hypothetical protein